MNWRQLNAVLPTLSEGAVRRLLEEECKGERRRTAMIRLHQRYTILRAARERAEILGDAEFPKVAALT